MLHSLVEAGETDWAHGEEKRGGGEGERVRREKVGERLEKKREEREKREKGEREKEKRWEKRQKRRDR